MWFRVEVWNSVYVATNFENRILFIESTVPDSVIENRSNPCSKLVTKNPLIQIWKSMHNSLWLIFKLHFGVYEGLIALGRELVYLS